VIGFEGEYAYTPDDPLAVAPSLKTGMGNVLLQTPFPIYRLQPYFTTGGGVYQEQLGTHSDTGFGLNTGGGVKVSLIGPIRLRVDYRIFKLGSGALNSPAHRFYAGLNLKF
jgi:opacity protein-like surface antigen